MVGRGLKQRGNKFSRWKWANDELSLFFFSFSIRIRQPSLSPQIFLSQACFVSFHPLISLPSSPCSLPVPVSRSSASSPGTYLLLSLCQVTFRHRRWNQNPSGLRRISRSEPIAEGEDKKKIKIHEVLMGFWQKEIHPTETASNTCVLGVFW